MTSLEFAKHKVTPAPFKEECLCGEAVVHIIETRGPGSLVVELHPNTGRRFCVETSKLMGFDYADRDPIYDVCWTDSHQWYAKLVARYGDTVKLRSLFRIDQGGETDYSVCGETVYRQLNTLELAI